jgi:hypothetical protein
VFVKVGARSDGSGGLQAILQARYVATVRSPLSTAKPTVAHAT